MSDIIPTGAYVIRNRETSAVLEITYNQGKLASVSPTDQDEENKREQQIWWVEADPCYDELNAREEKTAKEGGIYRLSNIAHYQSLDLLRGSCSNGTPVVGNKSHGAPWQLWRLRRRKEYTDGEYYYIVSLHSGKALESSCVTMPLDIDCESQGVFNGKQAWEFINPVASVPPGWLHLQNVSSGHVLSQTYSSLPPIARSTTLNSSAFPESWATQWALIRSSEWGYNTIRSRSYVIINRLAGGCLGSQASKFAHRGEEPGSVNAWEMSPSEKELWRLELDRQSNWKIVHQQSGFLLEEAVVPLLNGNEIVCVTKTPDKRRSWMFVPLKDIDRAVTVTSPPPAYNATGSGSRSTVE